MVEQQPSKLNTRVRFPSPAPFRAQSTAPPDLASTTGNRKAFHLLHQLQQAALLHADARGDEMLVVTTNDLPGYRVVKHLGVVRGLTVRSRSVIGNIGAAVQIFFGGNITLYTKLAEEARRDAFDLLVEHARAMGANAVLAMRYDANEIASAVTEVLAYGTAVVVEPAA
jgi:uncharacterized protein YbjQ (UPF0145 family)